MEVNPGTEARSAPLVILVWGNPSRGDDALGPLMAERLAAWTTAEGSEAGFELVEDFQLQVEHAMDLQGRQLALFIDAASGLSAPYVFEPLRARQVACHSTHALPPESVLAVAAEVLECEPPAAFLLALRGENFELGAPLSATANATLEAGWSFLQVLLRAPSADAWHAHAADTGVAAKL